MAAERIVPMGETISRPSPRGGDHVRLVPPLDRNPQIPIPPHRYYAEGEEESYYAAYDTKPVNIAENILLFDTATITEEQREYVKALGDYYEAKLQARGFAPWDGVLIDRTSREQLPNVTSSRSEPVPIFPNTNHLMYSAADE